MKELFNIDNPFMQLLTRVGDMIILNVLFLLCCVPVVTIGASTAALQKVAQDIAHDTDSGTVKTFFRAFRDNFKQATVVWLFVLLVIAGLFCDYLLIITFFSGSEAVKWMLILLAVLAVIVSCIAAYLIPMLVRYDNKLRNHVNNAVILAVIKLPRTLGLLALNFLPLIILLLQSVL